MRKTVEVFKTNVEEVSQAKTLTALLRQLFPRTQVSFDLEDCDKILRVEGRDVKTEKIVGLIEEKGFKCRILE